MWDGTARLLGRGAIIETIKSSELRLRARRAQLRRNPHQGPDAGAPDEDYDLLKCHFNEAEIAYLTLLVGAINVWNRVQTGPRWVHPVEHHKAA